MTFCKINVPNFYVPGFYGFKSDFDIGLSHRLDTVNDIAPIRMPIDTMGFCSSSFKSSFFHRVCHNYNALHRYDLGEFSHFHLRALFALFGVNNGEGELVRV